MRELTDAEVDYYLQYLPLMAARDAYPIAQMHADLLDLLKPRYLDPDPDPPTAPARRQKPWSPLELLPWYASFGEREGITTEQAESLVAAYDSLPEWARSIAPIDEARTQLPN